MTKIISHRGASAYEVENSLAAFRTALKLKTDMIELDVHRTKDKKLVVIHDKNLKRLCDAKLKISKILYKELSRYLLPNGEKIPLLKDVFKLVKNRCAINVELKSIFAEKDLVNLISTYDQESNVIVSSFGPGRIKNVKKLNPLIKTGFLVYHLTKKHVLRALALGAYSIHTKPTRLKKEVVDFAHKKGIKVYAWTVNNEHQMQKLINMDVDGIITDKPDVLRGVLKNY